MRTRQRLFVPLALLLACQTPPPLARPHGDGLFVSMGIDLAQAEARARQFCRERGEPIMRRVDKREVTIHVTGDPRIKQLELLFRCERTPVRSGGSVEPVDARRVVVEDLARGRLR